MGQTLLTLRVRPARVAVLADEHSDAATLVLAVRFLSQLWGGRYGPILSVSRTEPDPLTLFRLRTFRPDFVYGLHLDDGRWDRAVYDACQPRRYSTLDAPLAQDVRKLQFEDFIHVDRAVIAMFRARSSRSRLIRPLKVVSAGDSDLAPFCAAMFGVHHQNLAEQYQDEHVTFASHSVVDFVDLCRDFVEGWKCSWIDASGYKLEPHHTLTPPAEPTIVLVRDLAPDLAYFWNLRLASESSHPAWTIPIPFESSGDPALLSALAKWLNAFVSYGVQTNYCNVTSASIPQPDCQAFASNLKDAFGPAPVEFVDYVPPHNRLPLVIPFEHRVTWPAELNRRRLTFTPPLPRAFDGVGSRESWFVDILNDTRTRRAVDDVQLPPSVVVPELLNGPCPPNFERSVIPRFADGLDSVNVRCTSAKEVIDFHLPSADEVLEEVLQEYGYQIIHDEKRSSYLPTIKRFGSLYQAAAAFSGQSGQILRALVGKTLLPREIRSICRLGNGVIAGDDYLARVDQVLARESERTTRVAKRRFESYARDQIPERRTLGALLEHWADKSILTRRWELGPCTRCRQTYFVERLNIQRPILCNNCGSRLRLPEHIRIAYALARPVGHAIAEGIGPVALAGRFLKNMTSSGFFWLPGIKYRKGDRHGDIDLLACCDGHLIFGECKNLADVPQNQPVWDEVAEQLLETAAVAEECRADVVVLAVQAQQIPPSVERRITAALACRLPFLLLTADDLEQGWRPSTKRGAPGRLSLDEVVRDEFPEVIVQRPGGARRINLGWGVFTKQGANVAESGG